MLLNNQSIYALLLLVLGSIRMAIQGLVFDNGIHLVFIQGFLFNRFMVIGLSVLSVWALWPMAYIEI